jgi:uncharacterized membrane protein
MFNKLKNMSAPSFFLRAALFFELLLNLVTPPLQVPDEFNHFYRAYQVSEGSFLPLKQDQRLGGYMPQGIIEFTDHFRPVEYYRNYTISHREILYSFSIEPNEQSRKMKDFANTAYYSPMSYLPHAFIMFVLRQFHAPPAVLYFGGRLFMFFVWLFLMHKIITMLPVFKWLFTLLALLPVNIYLVNSFSADTVTNLLSFLFIALVLKHVFVTETITGRDVFVLGLVLIMLALSKVVYIGIALLLLAIPARKFKNHFHRIAFLLLFVLFSGLPALLWSNIVMKLYIPFKDYNPAYIYEATLSECGDYHAQKEYILSHGPYFFEVVWNSLVSQPARYLYTYVGVFGRIEFKGLWWLYLMTYTVVFIVLMTEKNAFTFSLKQRLILLSAAFLGFILLLLSQHLIWDCVGAGIVDFLQGRYLIPLLPLVFIALSYSTIKTKFNPEQLVIPFVFFLNMVGCYLLCQRFFIAPPSEIKEIYCNLEETIPSGFFKTSDPAVYLDGAYKRVGKENHSAHHSILLTPAAPYCFTYKFTGLRKGDLVEIEAWAKGDGAFLVVSGQQKGCGSFYYGEVIKSGRYKNGWRWIKNIYPYTLDCDSMKAGIYANYAGEDSCYMDDIKIKITHFTRQRDAE